MMTHADVPKTKWYYSVWAVLLMLFVVLGPLGLPFLWRSPRFVRWGKVTLTVVTLAYTVWLALLTRHVVRTALQTLGPLPGMGL